MQSSLIQNSWFGKALGFTGAWILAPNNPTALSIAVILGIGLGHLLDLAAARFHHHIAMFSKATSKRQAFSFADMPVTPSFQSYARQPQLRYLFTALGSIAKADGHVQPVHIQVAEALIERLQLPKAGRAKAIEWFTDGKSNLQLLEKLSAQCFADGFSKGSSQADRSEHQAIRTFTLSAMCSIAAAAPSDAALDRLKSLGHLIGYSASRVGEQFGAALEHQRSFEHSTEYEQHDSKPPAPLEDLTQAYETLGVDQDMPTDQIKHNYRKLMNRHHPDKLGPQATLVQINAAQQHTIKIQQAWDAIRTQRN